MGIVPFHFSIRKRNESTNIFHLAWVWELWSIIWVFQKNILHFVHETELLCYNYFLNFSYCIKMLTLLAIADFKWYLFLTWWVETLITFTVGTKIKCLNFLSLLSVSIVNEYVFMVQARGIQIRENMKNIGAQVLEQVVRGAYSINGTGKNIQIDIRCLLWNCICTMAISTLVSMEKIRNRAIIFESDYLCK